MNEETIAALATPPGQSGVAVVRISGGAVREVLGRIVRHPPAEWAPRRLYLRDLVDNDGIIDRGMVVFYPGPASYTGEDMAEFQVHGNPFLVQTLLAAVTRVEGVRSAGPGEFSCRAYGNGKMDLPQAEALSQLIRAGSDTAYRLSLNAMDGGVSRLAGELRSAVLGLSAWVETGIEFAEDQHLEMEPLLVPLREVREKLSRLLARSAFYDRLSQGLRIVIAGPANAGKSSLFNALLGDRRAIVSESPGTTRDVLKERFYLHHVAVELFDTAGINPESEDDLEREGVERGLAALRDASAMFFVVDASREGEGWEADFLHSFQNGPKAVLLNKTDLLGAAEEHRWRGLTADHRSILMSVRTGEGLDEVRSLLEEWSEEFKPSADDLSVSLRQRELLERVAEGIDRIQRGVKDGLMLELVAEEIRGIGECLSLLTGSVTPDDVLDRVFSTFCIGK